MLYRFLAALCFAACTMVMLSGCGDSRAAGTADFATVTASASSPGTTIDLNAASVAPISADYSITSTAYTPGNTGTSSTIQPSNLTISKVTVELLSGNSTSPVVGSFQTQFQSSGQVISPGGATTVSVQLVPTSLKTLLLTSIPAGTSVTYRAIVHFEALEVNTNRVGTITPTGFVVLNFTNA